MSPETNNPLWATDSQAFIHDQYETHRDYLIHAEQQRQQTLHLYFGFLATMMGVLGAAWSTSGPSVFRDLGIVFIVTNVFMGVYVYSALLSYRHITFSLRLELDKITLYWDRFRNDYHAYYHLPGIVAHCISNDGVPSSHSLRHSLTRRIFLDPIKRFLAILKIYTLMLLRLFSDEKEVLIVVSAISIGVPLAISLFTDPSAFPTFRFSGLAIWFLHLINPLGLGAIIWISLILVYVYRGRKLLLSANEILQPVADRFGKYLVE